MLYYTSVESEYDKKPKACVFGFSVEKKKFNYPTLLSLRGWVVESITISYAVPFTGKDKQASDWCLGVQKKKRHAQEI